MDGRLYDSLFSKGYWREAARQFSSVRMLAVCAMFIALRVALSSLFIPVTENLRIYFTFFVTALGATIYGPLMALAEGFISDLLGYVLFPSGGFFPGYTLTAMLGSLFYALFLYRRRLSVARVFLCKLTINVLVNILLGSLWSAVLYGKGYLYYVTKSVVKNTVLLPAEVLILLLVLRTMNPLLVRLRLAPAQLEGGIPFLARKREGRADDKREM